MIGAGIQEGDLAMVQPGRTANSGDIVVARTPDGEWTVKRLRRTGQTYSLEAENSKVESIPQPFAVVGIVKGVIRM